MKKPLLMFFVLAIAALLLTCSHEEKINATKKIKIAAGFETVENDSKPQGPLANLKFEEDLSITEKGWWPWELLIGGKDIYVLVGKENLLIKFDSNGTRVSSKKFQEGQGPGEFMIIDPCFSSDLSLYIADFSQRRLTLMDKEFEIRKILKLDFYGQVFRLDSAGNIYFLTLKLLPETTSKHRVVFTKYSPEGRAQYEIDEYIWGETYDKVKGKYVDELFRRQLKYKIAPDDSVYYATTDKYEINIVSPEGELLKRIKKGGQTREVTQEDINKVTLASPQASPVRREYHVPSNVPCIADLFILENGYLLVVTFESKSDDLTLAGDLFDDKGIYRARIRVPKYYRWDHLLSPSKNYAINKNSYLYTLEADAEEENFYVKRYKMIWEKTN